MSQRPRLVIVDGASESLVDLEALQGQVEVHRASTPAQALSLLSQLPGDAVLLPPEDESRQPRPTSQHVLEALRFGMALVDAELKVKWCNTVFANLCGDRLVEHERIYDLLDCDEVSGPDYSPFTSCLTDKKRASTRIRLKSGKRFEVTVQRLSEEEDSKPLLLCSLRDVTSEYNQREKLFAIHRAGLELSHLSSAELAEMSTGDRLDLLKANILQYSQDILEFKNFEIRVLDRVTNRLNVLLSEGMMDAAQGRPLLAEADGNGVTGFVAATGASYVCENVEHDPLYIPGAPDARSSMTVPLIYREQVVGTFNVESPRVSNFGERDCEFLEVFAREIAVALNTLELLQAESRFGGTRSIEAIVSEVSLPVDAIVADSIRLLDYLERDETSQAAHEAVKRLLDNAREIKGAIQKVGKEFEPPFPTSSEYSGPRWLCRRRILVVDHDPAVRRSAHWLMGKAGCEVDTAQDGNEAFTLVRSIRYDAVLSDIRLPDMNGYEFFCAMRDLRPETPIILMTGFGYDASHSLVKARQQGLHTVLYKPFRFDRLCEALEDALDPQSGRAPRAALAPKKQIL